MAETLSLISIISFIASGICFALAVLFFFLFKIPSVIGDLSGRNARKSIEQMRQHNEKTKNRPYRASVVNEVRGKLTGAAQNAGKPSKDGKKQSLGGKMPETELLAEDENATVFLNENGTEIIKRTGGVKLDLLEEVILIHTDEVIIWER